jgi:fucose permease
VQFALNGAFFASFMPRLPELRNHLGVSTGAIGVLLTVASASGLISSLTVRKVIARFGTQRVLFAGGVSISVALLGVGLSTTWPMALVALAVMFAFDVYVDVAMNMQGSWLSARRHRPMMNRLHGLWSLGSVAGGLVAAALAGSAISLRTHLAIAAAVLAAISLIIATQLLRTDEVHADEPPDLDGDPSSEPTPIRRLPHRAFFVAGLTAVAIETAAISWAAFRISDDLDGSDSVAALAYVAVLGGMTITRFAGDHLAARWGADRFMAGSAVLAIVSLLIAGVVPSQALAVAAFLVAGLGIATLTPRLYDLAARAGGGTASGLGVLTGGMRTATIVAPLLIATAASSTSVGTAIAAVSAVAGLGFVAATRPR